MMVSSSSPITLCGTYNPPSKNKPETRYFCLMDICRFHTFGMGSARMITSMTMLGTAFDKQNFGRGMQVAEIVKSQAPRIGMH